jgi:hypothetical protein
MLSIDGLIDFIESESMRLGKGKSLPEAADRFLEIYC